MAVDPFTRFVNSDYIKAYSFLNGSVEESYMNPAVRLAMDKYLQGYLGTDLYKKLQADISASSLTGVYETLMDDYVRICTVWWAVVELLPNLYVKIDNGGLVFRISDDTNSGDESAMTRLLKQSRENGEHYARRLKDYLCENSESFPEYKTNDEGQMPAGNVTQTFMIS